MTEERLNYLNKQSEKLSDQRKLIEKASNINSDYHRDLAFEGGNTRIYMRLSPVVVGQIKSLILEIEQKELARMEREFEQL